MSKKFCSECGNELKDSEKFCPSCGMNIEGEVSNKTIINQIFPVLIGLFGIFIVWFILGSRTDTSQYAEFSIYISILIGTAIEGFLYKKFSTKSIILGFLMGLAFVFYTICFLNSFYLPPNILDIFIIGPILGLIGATIGGYLNQTFKILN